MQRLTGKVAVITGGCGGIGLAVSRAMALEGAVVWVADISGAKAEETARQIGSVARSLELNVTDAASIARAVAEVMKHSGTIDILVNGAGVYGLQPWLSITEADYDRIMAVNARGLLFMTQAVAAEMIAKGSGGTIVNIASVAGRRGDSVGIVYAASKSAVISMTQSAALAFAKLGIRVNAIAPGPVETDMWEKVLAARSSHFRKSPDIMAREITASVPMGRNSSPEEQAGAVVFLASDESSYITGQTLNVDGGLYLS